MSRLCKQEPTGYLGVEDGGVLGGDLGAGDVGAEEGQGDERSGANSVALADGGGGVAGGVQRISALADVLAHARHLRNASGVVADGAICVDGQACAPEPLQLSTTKHALIGRRSPQIRLLT